MLPDWTIHALRVLVFLSLASGAYRGFKEMRAQGLGQTLVNTLFSLLVLAFIVGATMLVILYFGFVWPRHVVAGVAVACVYGVGGYALLARTLVAIQRRYGNPSQTSRLC